MEEGAVTVFGLKAPNTLFALETLPILCYGVILNSPCKNNNKESAMQATTSPIELAISSFKTSFTQLNHFLYGTTERAHRSIGLSFLALVLLQAYGYIGQTSPMLCTM